MSKIEWGTGYRPYEQGLDQGVLYLDEGAVPWNGLVGVDEVAVAQSGQAYYFDGNLTHIAIENDGFAAKLSAYTYPDEFAAYNGYSEQDIYKRFGLCYRTQNADGYLLHVVYGARLVPNEVTWKTIESTIDPTLFVWDISSTTLDVPGGSPTAHLVLDSRDLTLAFRTIQDVLYGTETTEPRLPTPAELVDIYESAMTLRITYHADGTYTAEGTDELVELLDDGQFRINAPTVDVADEGIFVVRSYA